MCSVFDVNECSVVASQSLIEIHIAANLHFLTALSFFVVYVHVRVCVSLSTSLSLSLYASHILV